MAGLTPDQKALFQAQEKKAEEGNRAIARAKELEERIAAIEAQRQSAQQPADPMSQMVGNLRERASFGDADASAQLSILSMTAQQAAETNLTNEMVKHRIPVERWDTVQGLIRQSGYRMGVASADQMARGSEVPALADQLKARDERIAALEKALGQRTVGSADGGNPATTTPAAVGGSDVTDVSLEDYQKMTPELRAKARIRH